MAESHSFSIEKSCELICPSRNVVDKECSAGFEDTDRLTKPVLTPLKILMIGKVVAHLAVPVVLAKVEWRIGENAIEDLIIERCE